MGKRGPTAGLTEAERFWRKVDRSEGEDMCWTWMGGLFVAGYGMFYPENKDYPIKKYSIPIPAHRYAFIAANGSIPDGRFVLHRCDNRRCVNPAHLFLGTHDENMADMAQKGRSHRPESRVRFAEKMCAASVKTLRERHQNGVSQRQLAKAFNISRSYVFDIVHRRKWAQV